jgi:hypothetical protein
MLMHKISSENYSQITKTCIIGVSPATGGTQSADSGFERASIFVFETTTFNDLLVIFVQSFDHYFQITCKILKTLNVKFYLTYNTVSNLEFN